MLIAIGTRLSDGSRRGRGAGVLKGGFEPIPVGGILVGRNPETPKNPLISNRNGSPALRCVGKRQRDAPGPITDTPFDFHRAGELAEPGRQNQRFAAIEVGQHVRRHVRFRVGEGHRLSHFQGNPLVSAESSASQGLLADSGFTFAHCRPILSAESRETSRSNGRQEDRTWH
jgi:hypothetical protein